MCYRSLVTAEFHVDLATGRETFFGRSRGRLCKSPWATIQDFACRVVTAVRTPAVRPLRQPAAVFVQVASCTALSIVQEYISQDPRLPGMLRKKLGIFFFLGGIAHSPNFFLNFITTLVPRLGNSGKSHILFWGLSVLYTHRHFSLLRISICFVFPFPFFSLVNEITTTTTTTVNIFRQRTKGICTRIFHLHRITVLL